MVGPQDGPGRAPTKSERCSLRFKCEISLPDQRLLEFYNFVGLALHWSHDAVKPGSGHLVPKKQIIRCRREQNILLSDGRHETAVVASAFLVVEKMDSRHKCEWTFACKPFETDHPWACCLMRTHVHV